MPASKYGAQYTPDLGLVNTYKLGKTRYYYIRVQKDAR